MTSTSQLPHWRLDNIFTDIDAEDFQEAAAAVVIDTEALARFFDEQRIDDREATASDATETVAESLRRLEEIQVRFRDLTAYLTARIDTDAFDDRAQAERSRLRPTGSRLAVLIKRFVAWVGRLDLESVVDGSEAAAEHRYTLERFQFLAGRLMGTEAEELAAVLDNSGGASWAQLHSALIGRGTIEAALPGREPGEYNVAELKQLQYDEDREVRRAAYEKELALLERNEVAYAAAMNSIKGQVGELADRRRWPSPLDESLYLNAMSRDSLNALQQAVRESLPTFRRYMTAKARFLGRERLAWYDLFAPVGSAEPTSYDWDRAREFVVDNFDSYSPRLSAFADRAFSERWMDAPSRKGKTNGAYCVQVPGKQESRILLNFDGKLDDLFTIAHELGHGFHNDCLYRFGRTTLQRSTPMTLAETASIFCETIVLNAILEGADDVSRLAILEQDLVGTNQIVVDIDSRFRFEHDVFERRQERELSVDEMKEIMLAAQEATYGEAVEADFRHPLMWAHKGHYYSSSRSFYNYPYTFGLLFGLGLYRVYQDEPEGFQDRYEHLLASTGMKDAASLGREFGIDIEDANFWRSSLAVFEERVTAFEALVEKVPR